MHLLSINISSVRTIGNANVSGQTGIYKLPVVGPVPVTVDGLADDAIVDTKNHGGPDQAVYVYGGADYAWWSAEAGAGVGAGRVRREPDDRGSGKRTAGHRRPAAQRRRDPGGDRAAHPVLEAGAAHGRSRFCETLPRRRAAGRLLPRRAHRKLRAGEPVLLAPYADEPVTIVEVFRDYYEPACDPAAIRRFLGAPLAVRARLQKEDQLREAERTDRKR